MSVRRRDTRVESRPEIPAPRVLYVVTHAISVQHLLQGQLSWMRDRGFEVAVVASPDPRLAEVAARERVASYPVKIPREIHPIGDLWALIRLYLLMRRWRPTIVNASTPKAGMLGMLAAFAARVPVRIYVLRGLRLETTRGFRRKVLQWAEQVTSACAHRVLAVSLSLAEVYVGQRLSPARKVGVLGSGSSKGVDVHRFAERLPKEIAELRRSLGIHPDSPVIGFVGRLTRDKGIVELVDAFIRLRRTVPDVRLLLIGEYEIGDPVPDETVRAIAETEGVIRTGSIKDVAAYYSLMDVLAFPSYREGFPNVPLEAAAAGLPVVGFRATGTVDAVVDGVTGTLVETGNVDALVQALARYLTDESLQKSHGLVGQQRVREEFRPERIWQFLLDEYCRLLQSAGCPLPAKARRQVEVS